MIDTRVTAIENHGDSDVLLTGFEPNDPGAHPQWFNLKNGTTPVWWDAAESKVIDDTDDAMSRELELAIEIGCIGFYDEDACEYRLQRYFSGTSHVDPLSGDGVASVPGTLLRQLGVYLLPSRRVWDSALTFSASSFIRVLKEQSAIPDAIVGDLRRALANVTAAPETAPTGGESEFGQLVSAVQSRLEQFGLIVAGRHQVKYRPTALDLHSILESLTPHVEHDQRFWIPLGAQGDGVIALQNLLLLLELGKRKRERQESFILLMEEPELHVHPALQQQIVGLARGAANQTIVSTHSPFVAAAFAPTDVHVLRMRDGTVHAEPLLPATVDSSRKNLLKRYTHQERLDFLGSVMGGTVIVPEGEGDADWIRWLMQLGDIDSERASGFRGTLPIITVLRTKSGKMTDTVHELRRLAVAPVVVTDGDDAGATLASKALAAGARTALRWPTGWEVEDVVSRVAEPALALIKASGDPFDSVQNADDLRGVLLRHKRDLSVRQVVIDATMQHEECAKRAALLMCDIGAIIHGLVPKTYVWNQDNGAYVLDKM